MNRSTTKAWASPPKLSPAARVWAVSQEESLCSGGEALESSDEVPSQGREQAVENSWSRDFMKCKAWRN